MSFKNATNDENKDIAISVSNLSKSYPVFEKPQHRLYQMLFGRKEKKYYKDFSALKSIEFDVVKGETVGIIGRNGSGKSTLLQLICKTLSPSDGSVSVKGKVAALLELGAGFNPEFTGFENIFMATAIYGLSQGEAEQRLQSIIDFADIGNHLHQPVKTYSSGMYVRLAFAVIAHVDADVLIIDEALAVGDAAFTQKCMRFIREFRKNGTLLFVSHDMNSILNLCERAIWLDRGELKAIGDAKDISEKYLQATLQDVYDVELNDICDKPEEEHLDDKFSSDKNLVNSSLVADRGWCSDVAEIVNFEILSNGNNDFIYEGGENVNINIRVKVNKKVDSAIVGITIKDRLGQALFAVNTYDHNQPLTKVSAIENSYLNVSLKFSMPKLAKGSYFISASMADGDIHVHTQHTWIHDIAKIDIHTAEPRFGVFSVDTVSEISNKRYFDA